MFVAHRPKSDRAFIAAAQPINSATVRILKLMRALSNEDDAAAKVIVDQLMTLDRAAVNNAFRNLSWRILDAAAALEARPCCIDATLRRLDALQSFYDRTNDAEELYAQARITQWMEQSDRDLEELQDELRWQDRILEQEAKDIQFGPGF